GGVQAVVAFWTKPDHIERLGIVLVLRVDILPPAELARTLCKLSVADGVIDSVLSFVCGGVFLAPSLGQCPGVRPAFWRFCPRTIISLHGWVCPCPRLDRAPYTLLACQPTRIELVRRFIAAASFANHLTAT